MNTSRFKQILTDPHTGEMLFFLGYVIYLGKFVWDSTMFPFPNQINSICLWISILLIGLKIVLFDRYTCSTLFGVAGIVLCSGAILYATHYTNAVFWIFITMGAKDIDFKKFLKVYLVVTGTIVALAVAASLIGVIENLQYYHNSRGVRNSFGIIYPTDFAAYIFFLMLVYFYLKGTNLRWFHFLGATILAGIVYYYCKTRLDCICILLLVLIFGIQHFFEQRRYGFERLKRLWTAIWKTLGPYALLLAAILSIVATYLYSPESQILAFVNKLFTSRLNLGKEGMNSYGISLFGRVVEMNGFGGSTIAPDNYFFIDCSYVHILLRLGIVFTLILVFSYTYMCMKHKKDIYFLFAIALVGINCIIAHHLIEVSYNPFAYALLMKLVSESHETI